MDVGKLLWEVFQWLYYVLDLWLEKKIKPRSNGRCRLIMYADDFVVAFENEQEWLSFKTLLVARLEQFKLKINENKTHVIVLVPQLKGGLR